MNANSNANFARGVAVAVSAIWAVVLFTTGVAVTHDVRHWLSYLPSAVGLLVVSFDLWLWKLPGVSKLTGRPHIYGTWRATLTPNPKSRIPDGGNWGPITAALVIEQSFWTTTIRLHTDQSNSGSTTAAIAPVGDSKQSKTLTFTYSNQASQQHNHRSHPHHGTARLQIIGLGPDAISGSYWTDRLTAGDLEAERISTKTDMPAAEALHSVQQAAAG